VKVGRSRLGQQTKRKVEEESRHPTLQPVPTISPSSRPTNSPVFLDVCIKPESTSRHGIKKKQKESKREQEQEQGKGKSKVKARVKGSKSNQIKMGPRKKRRRKKSFKRKAKSAAPALSHQPSSQRNQLRQWRRLRANYSANRITDRKHRQGVERLPDSPTSTPSILITSTVSLAARPPHNAADCFSPTDPTCSN
jgi:hypothetical protein